MGDLNYRIDKHTRKEAVRLIEANQLGRLAQDDQLRAEIAGSRAFHAPQKTPSTWCDRAGHRRLGNLGRPTRRPPARRPPCTAAPCTGHRAASAWRDECVAWRVRGAARSLASHAGCDAGEPAPGGEGQWGRRCAVGSTHGGTRGLQRAAPPDAR